jgi:hypothetical protein
METSKGKITNERVVFDCPKCGVHHDGPLTIQMNAEIDETDAGLPGEVIPMLIRQTMTTSACGDVLVTRSIVDEPTYDVSLLRFKDGQPPQLHVGLVKEQFGSPCHAAWPNVDLPDHPHRCAVRAGWHVNHACHCGAVLRVGDEDLIDNARRSGRIQHEDHR